MVKKVSRNADEQLGVCSLLRTEIGASALAAQAGQQDTAQTI